MNYKTILVPKTHKINFVSVHKNSGITIKLKT